MSKRIDRYGNKLILPDQPFHDVFLQFISNILVKARWFGVAGRGGVSWRLWAMCLFVLLFVIQCGAIWKVIRALAGWAVNTSKQRSVTARLAGAMFYAASLISQVLCWRLSRQWRSLARFWASIEWVLSIKYVPQDKGLKRRLLAVTMFISVFAIVEHLMSILAATGLDCPPSELLRTYILKSHGFLLQERDYHEVLALLILFTSNVATILWNFQDLLIVLVSMGLTSRYRRLNQCVATVSFKLNKEVRWLSKDTQTLQLYIWRKIREAYVKQAILVRKVNDALGFIILFSNFFNFYFICLQLFLGITQGLTGDGFQQAYYLVSLVWLCTRAACVVLAASNVYESSRKALPYLFACKAHCYNVEIERLQDQLSKDTVALSGMGFFSMTRTILLQIASSIITYVLVLIQYDNSSERNEEIARNFTNQNISQA